MVDLLDSDIGLVLKKTKLLYGSVAWMQSFTPELKEKILNWIRNDQLQKGIDEDGDIMGLYSEWTEMLNPEKVAGTPYTLKDSGAFYRSLFIDVLNSYFVVDGDSLKYDSRTGKTTDLFKWLGDGIVGLTDENLTKLSDELLIKYIEYVRRTLQIS